jgi:hypothetical protein
MSSFLRFTHKSISAFFILMLVTSGIGPSRAAAQVDAEAVAASPAALVTNLVQDPSFETSPAGAGPWFTGGGNPFCQTGDPGCPAPSTAPRSGSGWALFGRAPGSDFIFQNVTIPNCGATLKFYLKIGQADPGSGGDDFLRVQFDGGGAAIFGTSGTETERNKYPSYTLVSIPIPPAKADGAQHRLDFFSIVNQIVHFNVDDVTLVPGKCTIAGNARLPGVKLKYTDGTPKSTTSLANGSYSFKVPYSWSGTVTPSLKCYMFSPASRSYNNLTAKQVAQHFNPAFDPASPCAQIAVKIKETTQGTHVLPKNAGERLSFPDVNNGPMLVKGTGKNNVGFVASERVVSFNGGNMSSFFEFMGVPQNQWSTTYGFPAYDDFNFDSQLLLANVSTSTATVRIKIAGMEKTSGCTSTPSKPYPYTVGAGTTLRVRCAGANSGPFVVASSGAKIVASLRVLPKNSETSFSELMGLPSGQYDTSYAFPWYDGSTPVPQQLRVANVGSSATTISILIGGTDRTGDCTSSRPDHSFNIPVGKSLRAVCTGVNGGPVIVKSTGGVDIIASLRALTMDENTITAFSEWMGLPSSQLDTGYVFPWYNSKDLDTELRVGNLGSANTKVRIFIGGVEMTGCTSIPPKPYPYIVASGKNVRVSCANVNKGPLRVTSSGGVPIVASLSILPRNVGAGVSELLGLPLSQLTTGYAFPSYDNVNLDMQLRFAVP